MFFPSSKYCPNPFLQLYINPLIVCHENLIFNWEILFRYCANDNEKLRL